MHQAAYCVRDPEDEHQVADQHVIGDFAEGGEESQAVRVEGDECTPEVWPATQQRRGPLKEADFKGVLQPASAHHGRSGDFLHQLPHGANRVLAAIQRYGQDGTAQAERVHTAVQGREEAPCGRRVAAGTDALQPDRDAVERDLYGLVPAWASQTDADRSPHLRLPICGPPIRGPPIRGPLPGG